MARSLPGHSWLVGTARPREGVRGKHRTGPRAHVTRCVALTEPLTTLCLLLIYTMSSSKAIISSVPSRAHSRAHGDTEGGGERSLPHPSFRQISDHCFMPGTVLGALLPPAGHRGTDKRGGDTIFLLQRSMKAECTINTNEAPRTNQPLSPACSLGQPRAVTQHQTPRSGVGPLGC